jgi:hypothetical protein
MISLLITRRRCSCRHVPLPLPSLREAELPQEELSANDMCRVVNQNCEETLPMGDWQPGRARALFILALVLAAAMVGQAGIAFAAGTKSSRTPKSKSAPEAQKTPPTADLVAAKQAYEEALRAFNLGQWDEAIAGFQKSYMLSGDAALLFNVAQAQRQAGHVKEAIITYKAFLRERPETPKREMVEAKIKDLESAAEAKTAAEKSGTAPTQADRLTGVWEDPFAQKAAPALAPTAKQGATALPAPIAPPPALQTPSPTQPTTISPASAPPPTPAATAPALALPLAPANNEPPAAQQPALDLHQKPASEAAGALGSGSLWWLWTGIGVVVAAAVATTVAVLLTRNPGRDSSCPSGLDGCIPVGK